MNGFEKALGHRDCPDIDRSKGYKDCPCGMRLPIKAKRCDCGHIFYKVPPVKTPKGYTPIEDWKNLQPKDRVFLNVSDIWESPDGEFIQMGKSGEYQVIRIQEDGLVLYNKHGYSFCDMINTGLNKETGITRAAVKVFLKKVRND